MPYAELHCISNFTFLRGASHPEELVARAAELGYQGLAITDECSLAGVVRAHVAAGQRGLKLIVGAEFRLEEGLRLVLLAADRKSYGELSELITIARRNADKGEYRLNRSTLQSHCPGGCLALWLPDVDPDEPALLWLGHLFPRRIWIAVELLLTGEEGRRLSRLQALGRKHQIPLCAAGDVHMHVRNRRVLQDTLTAIRLGKPLSKLGYALYGNGERHLRSLRQLGKIYPQPLLDETLRIAEQCRFSLDELRYEYPHELVPKNHTPQSWLKH